MLKREGNEEAAEELKTALQQSWWDHLKKFLHILNIFVGQCRGADDGQLAPRTIVVSQCVPRVRVKIYMFSSTLWEVFDINNDNNSNV